MNTWPSSHSVFISRCFWDYYLHVFQKQYAFELVRRFKTRVTWFDPPTRNPLTWFRERKREINGVVVRRPFAIRNENERFLDLDRKLFNIQLRSSLKDKTKPDLWSVACAHPWLASSKSFSKSIYWPGDYFNPEKEFNDFESYDLVMPWTPQSIENIPRQYKGIPFLSSTCAGSHFMEFDHSKPLNSRFDFKNQFTKTVVYIGGLSTGRVDFELLSKLAYNLPDHAILMGAKPDGNTDTLKAVKAITNFPNVFIFEELKYHELAELTHAADVCIIPYHTTGFNAGCCPNKFFEYSALGKSTISTPVPSLEVFLPYVSIAQNHDEFTQMVKVEALKNPSETKRDKLLELAVNATPKATLGRMKQAFAFNQQNP